jgi:hypothetical protein
LQISHPYEAEYEQWCVFAESRGDPVPKNTENAVARVKSFLERGLKRSYPFKVLREKFYFVQFGIDAAYSSKAPRAAISYVAFVEYHRRWMSPQSGDELLAEDVAIS